MTKEAWNPKTPAEVELQRKRQAKFDKWLEGPEAEKLRKKMKWKMLHGGYRSDRD